ncbi:hypothetical protein WG66_007833 [Moniliophthora roreri]|nr:hypothetical protein WG66_007833 [Moniliophthora roreri]
MPIRQTSWAGPVYLFSERNLYTFHTENLDNAFNGFSSIELCDSWLGRYTLDESWQRLLKEVGRYDDNMVKDWKEDIDTLLVFVRVVPMAI